MKLYPDVCQPNTFTKARIIYQITVRHFPEVNNLNEDLRTYNSKQIYHYFQEIKMQILV
jgi:hypothetical protein